MAKTSYIAVTPEQEEAFYSDLQSGDRFISPRIRSKGPIMSAEKIAGLTRRSYLPAISLLWRAFSDPEKQAWKDVDAHPRQHGWRTFVGDQAKRIKFGHAGLATPNIHHQDMVGKILIQSPAEEIKLIQPHPYEYWVSRKVPGKKRMYEPVEIEEPFSLPLKLTMSYKSDLVSTGAGSFTRLYASIRHLYQGVNRNTDLIIEIPLSSAWATDDVTETVLIGDAVSYNLYIHLYKVTGTLLFDNIKAEHSGSNWVRDTYCKKIEQGFSRGFYQVPKHWGVISQPVGADYESVYPT